MKGWPYVKAFRTFPCGKKAQTFSSPLGASAACRVRAASDGLSGRTASAGARAYNGISCFISYIIWNAEIFGAPAAHDEAEKENNLYKYLLSSFGVCIVERLIVS